MIGVDAAAGRGIATGLLTAVAGEAARRGLRRLELTVMTDNLRARSLPASGFQVEGLRREALAAVIDEYYMGRLLLSPDAGLAWR